ncbi:MAG: dihydroorotase [Burkholderiaceae bacterium]
MNPRITLRGARVLDPASGIDRIDDLHLAQGRVLALGAAPDGFEAELNIDLSGRWLMPGLIDLAARMREPGFEYRASLESELRAAMAGGITSVCCPPDTDPPLDEPGLVEMLKHRARMLAGPALYPLGALTVGLQGEVITEMGQLTEAGCVGFAQPGCLPVDTQSLARALEYASTFGFTVWLQPQDPHLGRGGVAHSGRVASRLGLPSVPVTTETVALHTVFELVRAIGARVHLCRISSAAGVELLRRAKHEGLPVSADVAIHHLHLTDVDIGHFDSRYRVDPPFRDGRDRDALGAALADGTIDAVCSDHTPVDDDSKQVPFAEAEPGLSALELLLPLLVKWSTEHGIDLLRALGGATDRAARVLGIEAGSLAPGQVADLCVFDPQIRWQPGPATLRSQCRFTPFSDYEIMGRTSAVVLGGRYIPID